MRQIERKRQSIKEAQAAVEERRIAHEEWDRRLEACDMDRDFESRDDILAYLAERITALEKKNG
jgi:hypothetical protein